MSLVLVIGGIRSGKSEVAERLAAAAGAPVCYLATGSADDPEMAERIARHRLRRPASWRTVTSDDPAGADVGEVETLLVDGIAPWLARLMREGGLWTDEAVAPLGAAGRASYDRAVGAVRAFARAAVARPGLTVVAAEESGLGLVPHGAGPRRYLDLAGEALQALAGPAARVLLVVAGRAIDLDRTADLGAGLAGVARPPPLGASAAAPPGGPAVVPPGRPSPGSAPPGGSAVVPPGRPSPGSAPPGGSAAAPLGGPAGGRVPAELRLHGDTMVTGGQLDFAVNVVPGGPPGWLRNELLAALDRAPAYPDERGAVAALAERHGRTPGEVLPTNGSAEAFWLLASVLQPARAVVVHPSFTEPEAALRAAGHPVERAFREPRHFTLDPSVVPANADLVLLGNPNNPTGTLDSAEVVARLVRPGRLVVVDEAFMELVPGEPDSLAARLDLPGVVVVRSLTKAWALAGVRAGYLLAAAEIVAWLRAVRQPWSVNGLACAALSAWARRTLASGGAEAAVIAHRVAAARAELAAALATLPGVLVWPSAANFLLVRVADGPAVRAGLGRRGIAVRPACTFPGLTPDHLRLAVREPADNRRLVEALRELLAARPPPEHRAAAEGTTAPEGQPLRGEVPRRQPPQASPPEGQPPRGQPSQGQPSQGQPSQGQPPQGQARVDGRAATDGRPRPAAGGWA